MVVWSTLINLSSSWSDTNLSFPLPVDSEIICLTKSLSAPSTFDIITLAFKKYIFGGFKTHTGEMRN